MKKGMVFAGSVAGGIGINSVCVNNNTTIDIRSVLYTGTRSVRKGIGRTLHLRGTNYSVMHIAIPSGRTLGAIRTLGGTVGVPLITSVRFSCHLTISDVTTNISGMHVGPNGVNSSSGIGVITSTYEGTNIPVEVNIGSNSLRGRVLTGCNNIAPRTVIRDNLCRVSLLRGFSFSSVMLSLGSSSAFGVCGTCRLTTRGYGCPLRLNIARTNARGVNIVGSTTNVNKLLLEKVNGAVHVSLASSPIGRIRTNVGLLGTVKLYGSKVGFISYPAYKEARVSLVGVTTSTRGHLGSIGGGVAITVVNYVMGNPNRTSTTSVNVTNNGNYNILFGGNRVVYGLPRRGLLSTLVRRVRGVWKRRGITDPGFSRIFNRCFRGSRFDRLSGTIVGGYGLSVGSEALFVDLCDSACVYHSAIFRMSTELGKVLELVGYRVSVNFSTSTFYCTTYRSVAGRVERGDTILGNCFGNARCLLGRGRIVVGLGRNNFRGVGAASCRGQFSGLVGRHFNVDITLGFTNRLRSTPVGTPRVRCIPRRGPTPGGTRRGSPLGFRGHARGPRGNMICLSGPGIFCNGHVGGGAGPVVRIGSSSDRVYY